MLKNNLYPVLLICKETLLSLMFSMIRLIFSHYNVIGTQNTSQEMYFKFLSDTRADPFGSAQ